MDQLNELRDRQSVVEDGLNENKAAQIEIKKSQTQTNSELRNIQYN